MKATTTTLGAALANAGLAKHQVKAYSAAADFINAGGTRPEWMQVFDLVAGKITERTRTTITTSKTTGAVSTRATASKEPPPTATDLKAEERTWKRAAVSVFDRYVTHSGRMWGNVAYNELDNLADDGTFAANLKAHIGQIEIADRSKKIRDLVNARDFVQLARKAGIKAN